MKAPPSPLTILLFAFVAWSAPVGSASDYAQRKAAARQHCETISPNKSQSGLAFNPDGLRSYYVQSECFQNAAVQFRDSSLCDRVRRRWSLFWSSWGISSAQCRKLVVQGIETDHAEIEDDKGKYVAGRAKLLSFHIERNGNGRDFDILPEFTAGYGHGYRLAFEIVDVPGRPVLVHSEGYYLDPNSRLRIFVRQSEIRSRFPEFELNRAYKVRATVTLSIGNEHWSDEYLENLFPARERSQSLTIESRF